MKITPKHRKRLTFYLREFYKRYPEEKFTVFHFVRYFKLRLKDNKDAWMGVSGETGTGKSMLVITCQILFGRPMDLIKNISYIPKGDEIIRKFQKLNFQTFLVDEAAKDMRAVDWHSKTQQQVNVVAMTERFKTNWVFLNIPNFNEFTKSMRLTNIIFRAIIVYRTDLYARVIIQRKSRNWRSDDPWGDKAANEKYSKLDKRKRIIDNDSIIDIERGLPNYVMDFIVPNLEVILPDITDEYQRLKIESRHIDPFRKALTKKENLYKNKYHEMVKKITRILVNNTLELGQKKRVPREDMAAALGINRDTFRRMLKAPLKGERVPTFRRHTRKKRP